MLCTIKVYPSITFERTITIKTANLDTFCNEQGIETIDFIWMDVQGAEIDIIQGGQNTLTKTRFIYTEYSRMELYEGQATLRQLLKQLKTFKILVKYPKDVLLQNKKFELPPNKVLKQMNRRRCLT